jgi:hypothetical protein
MATCSTLKFATTVPAGEGGSKLRPGRAAGPRIAGGSNLTVESPPGPGTVVAAQLPVRHLARDGTGSAASE